MTTVFMRKRKANSKTELKAKTLMEAVGMMQFQVTERQGLLIATCLAWSRVSLRLEEGTRSTMI